MSAAHCTQGKGLLVVTHPARSGRALRKPALAPSFSFQLEIPGSISMMSSGKGENAEGRRDGRQTERLPEEGEGEKERLRNEVTCHEDKTNDEI